MFKSPLNVLYYRLPVQTQRMIFRNLKRAVFLESQEMRRVCTTSGYSYRPFDDHKCIFVRIPKCASRSISKSLFGNLAGGHATIRRYRLVFSPEEFRSYFKFTIVRNPWDRLVSAFFFLKKGGLGKRDREWAEANLSPYSDFDDFVKRWLKRKNVRLYEHFRPQRDFICAHGSDPLTDFVGYYENIEQDFSTICDRLGIKRELLTTNVNRDRRRAYMTYCSDETREIVAEVYREDISLLGYNFDSSSSGEQGTKCQPNT